MSAKDPRGSVTVLAAGVLFLACALSLVSVDLLRGLQAKARAQTAADAAALAAARSSRCPRPGRRPRLPRTTPSETARP